MNERDIKRYGISNSIKRNEKYVGWAEFNRLVDMLAYKINDSQYSPTILTAVSRGGWIPTWYLSEKLRITKINSIGIRYNEERTELDVYSLPTFENTHVRILLIEDVLATGNTMLEAKDLLEEKGYNVKTVSLHYVQESNIIPDFNCGIIDQWLNLPWEFQD